MPTRSMPNRIRIAALLLGLAALQTAAYADTILFVGNSFTFGGGSPPVQGYRPETVTDLNLCSYRMGVNERPEIV